MSYGATHTLEQLVGDADIHELLDTWLVKAYCHDTNEVDGFPHIYVRHLGSTWDNRLGRYDTSDYPTAFAKAVEEARVFNALPANNINAVPTIPVLHGKEIFAVMQFVDGERLDLLLKDGAKGAVVNETNRLLGSLSLYYMRAKEKGRPVAGDLLLLDQYMYGTVEDDQTNKARLVDTQGGITHLDQPGCGPDYEPNVYERDLLWIAQMIIKAEHSSHSNLSYARAKLLYAASIGNTFSPRPKAILQAVATSLESGQPWDVYKDDIAPLSA